MAQSFVAMEIVRQFKVTSSFAIPQLAKEKMKKKEKQRNDNCLAFKSHVKYCYSTAAHIMEVEDELKLKRIISAQQANLSKSSISKAAASAQLKICQLGREEAKLSIIADEL